MSTLTTSSVEDTMPNPKTKQKTKPKKFVLKCCAKLWENKTYNYEEIKTIQKYIRLWHTKINKLEQITYMDDKITYSCINMFMEKNRSQNDGNNKKRENIVGCIINNNIPKEYYRYSRRWYNLKNTIDLYIKNLCERNNINDISNISCIHKAGRGNHYDFKIIINNNKEFIVEFKYNALCVIETPQFVSPMKPSQYLNMEFEPWFYDNYLIKIVKYGNLKMPSKDEYCKKIHNNEVDCMKEIKEKYDTDSNFNKYCKQIDKEAIKKFIELTEIDMDKLSNYLEKSQANKHYMCYHV